MDIIDSVLSYFLDNKCSPFDTPQSAANELKKLRETVISFIRQQEKKTLLPMKQMIEEMAKDMGSFKTPSYGQNIDVPKPSRIRSQRMRVGVIAISKNKLMKEYYLPLKKKMNP